MSSESPLPPMECRELQLMVKFIGLEVSANVPPLPYIPVPGVPGLVTVTWTVPEVAIMEVGIATMS